MRRYTSTLLAACLSAGLSTSLILAWGAAFLPAPGYSSSATLDRFAPCFYEVGEPETVGSDPRGYPIIGTAWRFGWPCTCLAATVSRVDNGGRLFVFRVDLPFDRPPPPRWILASPQGGPVLPTEPLWAGLIANTALFSAAWLGLLLAPGAIARHRRRSQALRRNRCPRCAYDLRGLPVGSPCPECGTRMRPQR